MQWDRILFVVFLALGALVAALIFAVPESPHESGSVHPRYPSMSYGGDSERHTGVRGWAYGFGTLSIVSFAVCIAFCVRRRGTLRGLGPHLVWTTLVFLALWTLLVAADAGALGSEVRRPFLLFPLASSIMVYVLYPASALYSLLFVAGFRRWVLSDDDYRAYRTLVEQAGQNDT